ncbi:hypothetical protein ELG97_15050 [Rhizobium leguminosarum]|uniref:hypothetical protein n=1 Tax=Rhizobium leguminosarum TaxID=384 RepID=UPI00102F376E|nr:hypothetical protein [Rhizobium leguminosarum]TBE93133.1 hypothetical protein ELG97_15050 [Rhizobium leguminosarum]
MTRKPIDEQFLEVMRAKGATDQKAVNLVLIGPEMIAAGFTEEQAYRSLINLAGEGIIVLDEETNRVSFPVDWH